MTPERWQQVKEIFSSAVQYKPEGRASFLSQACGGDEALRKEVESLLVSHEKNRKIHRFSCISGSGPTSLPLLDSLVVILEAHDVVFAEIVAKLNFNDGQFDVAAVSQAMIGFGWDVDVLALLQLQLLFATDYVGHAFDYDPMLAAPRMSL